MKEKWERLALREKQSLVLGAIGVIIFLFYEMIWSPLTNEIDFLRDNIPHKQALLNWMEESDKQIQAFEKKSVKTPHIVHTSLLGILQKEIQHASFAKQLTQLKQAENNSVLLNFQEIDFDQLMKWLIQLWQQGMTVTQLSVTASQTPGIVNVELIVS